MINLDANQYLKNLGCKWQGSMWVAPEIAEEEAQNIKDKYYNDLVTVRVIVKDGLKGSDFGYSHARLIAGYVVATASGRDSGARIADGVAILNGKAKSGGSVKNYVCVIDEDSEIKMKVSRNLLPVMDEEVSNNRYTYEVIGSEESLESLKAQKQDLLKKLNEIDNKISMFKCNS